MFKNLSLQGKLISAFSFLGAIVLLVAIIGWGGSSRLSSNIQVFSQKTFPSTTSLWKVNEAQTRVMAAENVLLSTIISNDRRQKELNNITKAMQDIKDGWGAYEKLERDPGEDKLYNNVKSEWDKWTNASQDFLQLHSKYMAYGVTNPTRIQIQLLQQGQNNNPEISTAQAAMKVVEEMINFNASQLDPTFNTATDKLLGLLDYNSKLADEAQKRANIDVKVSNFSILIGLLFGPLTAISFGIVLSRSIANKVRELVKVSHAIASSKYPGSMADESRDEIGKLQTAFYTVAEKIAELVNVAQKISSGDLSAEISQSDKQDEIGKLQTAFYRMNKDLNSLIRRIQQSVVQITTSSTQIAASGKQLEATVTEQLASTNEVTATAQQISTTAKKLVKMMDNVASMTQKTATAASDSREELGEMENTMRQLTEATTSITSKLGVMNKKASNINNVVVTITKVADQTSILSLNAAIEAEKAGEYGAGFAVVAREIRRLANQTAVATLEIEQIVKDMQSAVAMGVMEMDKFNKSVSDSVEQVNKISHQIAKVINQVQSLPPQFQQVSETMNDQSQGAQQISEAMEQLSEASQQTVDALRETNNALEQLDEAAKGLREEITHFKLQN